MRVKQVTLWLLHILRCFIFQKTNLNRSGKATSPRASWFIPDSFVSAWKISLLFCVFAMGHFKMHPTALSERDTFFYMSVIVFGISSPLWSSSWDIGGRGVISVFALFIWYGWVRKYCCMRLAASDLSHSLTNTSLSFLKSSFALRHISVLPILQGCRTFKVCICTGNTIVLTEFSKWSRIIMPRSVVSRLRVWVRASFSMS